MTTANPIPRHIAARFNLWVDTKAGYVTLNGLPLTATEADELARGLAIGADALRARTRPTPDSGLAPGPPA